MGSLKKFVVLVALLVVSCSAVFQQPAVTVPSSNSTGTTSTGFWRFWKRDSLSSTLEPLTTDAQLERRDSGSGTATLSLDATNSTSAAQSRGDSFTLATVTAASAFKRDVNFTTASATEPERTPVATEGVVGRNFHSPTTTGFPKIPAASSTPATSTTSWMGLKVTLGTSPHLNERKADITTTLRPDSTFPLVQEASERQAVTTSLRYTEKSTTVLPLQWRLVGVQEVNSTDADRILRNATHQVQERDAPDTTMSATVNGREDRSTVTASTYHVHRRHASTTDGSVASTSHIAKRDVEDLTSTSAVPTSSEPIATDI